MPSPYSEWDLIVPALRFLRDNPQGLTTTQVSQALREQLKPSGSDLNILAARSDDSFSQKVRNIFISDPSRHHSLLNRGFVIQEGGRNSPWHVTEAGLKHLLKREPDSPEELEFVRASLQEQGIAAPEVISASLESLAGVVIEEGRITYRSTRQRLRSHRLREAAIARFREQHEGRLFCAICGFDFESTYGDLGKGFIEVHHVEPVREYESIELVLALERVVPLCSNCHRMIHRRSGSVLSLVELRALLQAQG